MTKRVPRFKELIMNERDKKTNDPLMWCRGDDGEIYMLQLDETMLIPFALALLFEADRATPPDQDQTLAVLPVAGFATGFGAEGDPTIRFQLENGAHIGIVLGRDLLSPLREQVANLEIVLQRESRD